jgi:glutamine synthetase adenylyltransferase
LVDIEFLVQHGILSTAGERPAVWRTSAAEAIEALAGVGWFNPEEAGVLGHALEFLLDLQQALRIASGDDFDPARASAGFKSWLAGLVGEDSFEAIERRLRRVQRLVGDVWERKLGPLPTDGAHSGV